MALRITLKILKFAGENFGRARFRSRREKLSTRRNLLNLGGVYGDKDAGNPIEYDHLKLVLMDD